MQVLVLFNFKMIVDKKENCLCSKGGEKSSQPHLKSDIVLLEHFHDYSPFSMVRLCFRLKYDCLMSWCWHSKG